MPKEEPPKPPLTKPFRPARLARQLVSGSMSTFLLHPLDVLKLRMQISPSHCGTITMASQIYKSEGWKAFYNGATAGLLRQATYTMTRLAVYDVLYDWYAGQYKKKPIRRERVAIGITAGMVGAFVGNPSEVVLVRRMAGAPPAACQPCSHSYYCIEKYKGTIDALKRIKCEEGYRNLWRGATLTMFRSVFLSVGQVGIYFKMKEVLRKNNVSKDKHMVSFLSSIITTFLCAAITHPIDMIKSIYQSSNQIDTMKKIVDRIILCRGIKELWKGFVPYYTRMAVHTIMTFMLIEEIKERTKRKNVDEKDAKKK